MLEAHYNLTLKAGWLETLGKRVINVELAFNRQAGFTNADDRLPAYFETEAVPPKGLVFDVSTDALDSIWLEEEQT
jgi:aldehyde:ferredoxin oxidoreductase